MRKEFVLGLVIACLGSGEALATPTINLLPAWTATSEGAAVVLTVQLVNDLPGPDLLLTAFTFGVQRTGGDATITSATRQIPPGAASVGGALNTSTTSVFTLGGLSLAGIASGTYTLGTVTVRAGSEYSTFEPVQRPNVDQWYAYNSRSYENVLISPVRNGALITPEPATASLLGVGLVGLVLAGRRGCRAERRGRAGATPL